MLRRQLLALPAAAAAMAISSRVRGTERSERVRSLVTTPGGTTFELTPKSAPYAASGRGSAGEGGYGDPTVLLFVPSFFRLPRSKRIDFVVHFHGHHAMAKEVIRTHKLREQLASSRQNAVLIVPQGPVRAADGDFGKLMLKNGLARLLDEITELAARSGAALGEASLDGARDAGRVVVSAHSGGYRAAAACALRGGVDAREVYLFDALYGESAAFRDFVMASPERHKLVSYYVGGRPRELSVALADSLAAGGVRVLRERNGARLTREEMVHGQAVFLQGRASHASATYEELALRDCLFASCLVGRGSKAWHADGEARRSS